MQILLLRVRPSEIVSRPTGRRLPTWEVACHPTTVGVPVNLQGAYATSQQKYYRKQYLIAFYNTNHIFVSFMQNSFALGLQ